MVNIVKDMSALSTIDELTLKKLSDIATYSISDAIANAKLAGEDVVDLYVGIGTVSINIAGDAIRYRFTPNNYLEQSVKNAASNGSNALELSLEKSLVDKVCNTYRSFL